MYHAIWHMCLYHVQCTYMNHQPKCIFCMIASGESPSHTVWENDTHLAFLSIFPNTEGFTVVIPKEHYGSYLFDQLPEVINELVFAAQETAKVLDTTFEDVGRTGLMFEGFGVDHLHAKLFPMHGTKTDAWQARASKVDKYFDHYEGYMSSHDFERADDTVLTELARKMRGE